jgi:deoxyribodipyrimidine photo-lyase
MTRAIVWFRRDLSLDDNLAWTSATTDHREVLPAYVLDPRLLDAAGPFRRRQLLASLAAFADEICATGGRLTVAVGDPAVEIPRLARANDVRRVVWNGDVTAYARSRDTAVSDALSESGIATEREWSTLVQPPGTILTAAGSVPRVFSRFHERWSALELAEAAPAGSASVLSVPGVALPAPDAAPPQRAGSDAARARLTEFLDRADEYDHARDLVYRDATSQLSSDLHFGAISPRAVVRAVGRATPGRRAFTRQLAWRDWYAHLFAARPELVDHSQQPAYDQIEWRDDPIGVDAWKAGRTGFPIVDAAMRELAATGWMHNRLRLITASFLVKDLLVDWRIGERHFRRLLVDGDVSQNAGNWQWVAGTGPDAAPYFRVFNPLTQARRFDPEGEYVRRWLPELRDLPGGTIHAPSALGPLELARARVVLGDNYPAPIVDHAAARVRALAAYAAVAGT